MSLPTTINTQDETFFSLDNLILDPDLLYLYSLKDTDGISEKSVSLNTNEASLTTPLESYNSTVNFEKDVYTKIRNESNEIIENKSFSICKSIRNSMNEFHLRASVQLASALTDKIYNPFALCSDLAGNYEEIKEMALTSMKFDKLPGINPKKWPLDLDKLLSNLEDMPFFSFFHEPLHYYQDFFLKAQEYITECIAVINSEMTNPQRKEDEILNIIQASKVVILIYLLSGQFPNYLKSVKLIQRTSESLTNPFKLDYLNHMSFFMSFHINKIRLMAESTPRLHYARSLCDEGGFKIAKVAHFQKQTFLTTSLTTDGTYIYLYVSASNGGMYKIGTGEKDTIAGKIYLFVAVCRQEEVAWVFCKGKLYLRSSSKEFGSIDVICPNTFKFEGMIQLYCPEVFGHPSLQIINKNYPLLTDGEYLYIIGKKLISEKINSSEEGKEEVPKGNEESVILSYISEPFQPPSLMKMAENQGGLIQELPAQEIIKELPKILEDPSQQKLEEQKAIPQSLIELPKEQSQEPKKELIQSLKESIKEEHPKDPLKEEPPKEFLKEELPKPINEEPSKEILKEEPPKEPLKEALPLKEHPKEPLEQPKELQQELSHKEDVMKIQPLKEPIPDQNNLSQASSNPIPLNPLNANQFNQIWNQFVIEKHESKSIDAVELESELAKEKVDSMLKEKIDLKEIMDKGEEDDIFKDSGEFSDIIKGGGENLSKKASLLNKKFLEKPEKSVAPPKREENKKKKDKKAVEIIDSENTLKLCEFILYEFDLTNPLGVDCFNEANMSQDKELIQELFESFNGFYSYNECARALSFNKDDIANAAQWLVDEGEKERTKKTIMVRNSTLLAQSEVVSDISNKNLKNNAEILTKDDSIIFPMNVSANIWTMNCEQLTLYSENGIKIFSKNSKDIKPLVLKKPNPQSSEPIENMPKSNYFLSGNEDFFKKHKNLSVENNELVDSLLEHDFQAVDNTYLHNIPQWGAGFWNEIKNSKDEKNAFKDFKEAIREAKEGKDLRKYYGSEIIPEEIKKKETIQNLSPPEILKETILNKIPKKLALKGSHIMTIEGKKGFHPHSNFHMSYDSYMKKYYVMNWTWNSYTNVLPSLITIAYDYESYEERSFLIPLNGFREMKSNLKTYSPQKCEKSFEEIYEGINDLLMRLMRLQRRRFSLPWILNNWEYTYGYALVEVVNKKAIIASLKDLDVEKKKLSTQKNKLVSRLNKYLSYNDKKTCENHGISLVELKKRYAGCIDGSLESFEIIFEICKEDLEGVRDIKDEKKFDNLFLWLQYLQLWVKHSDVLAVYEKDALKVFSKFDELCYEILKDPEMYHNESEDSYIRKIYSLLWRLVMQGFEIFIRETTRQVAWLKLIFSYSNLTNPSYRYTRKHESFEGMSYRISDFDEYDLSPLSYFFMRFSKWNEGILPDYPLKESLIEMVKPEEIVKKVDSNTNFFNTYRKFRTVKLKERTFMEPIGRLLIQDLQYLFHIKTNASLFEEFYPKYFITLQEEEEEPQKIEEISKRKEKQSISTKTKEKTTKIEEETSKIKEEIQTKDSKLDLPFPDYINIEGIPIKMSEFNPKIKISSKRLNSHYILSNEIWSLFEEKLLKAFEIPSIDGLLIFRLFLDLLLESWLEISRIEDGFFEAFFLTKFTRKLLSFLEKILMNGLQTIFTLNNNSYSANLLSIMTLILNSMLPLIHQSNMLKYSTLDLSIVEKLLSILKTLIKYTETISKSEQKLNLLSDLFTISNEGADQINEKIFETNHPYERGKVQSFDFYHFPGALAISVEMDKRCQSDTTNDYLVVAGWYNHHASSMGLHMSPRDGVGTCYRISGKPNMKRPLVLLGNTIQVEFSSSGHAKDEQSLNRWGFKVVAKGIYGCFKKNLWAQKIEVNELNELISKFGGEKSLSDWFNGLRVLALLLNETLEKNLKGTRLSNREIENSSYLKWTLVKKGLQTLNLSHFLQNQTLESRSLAYKDNSNDGNLYESLGICEESFDIESQSVKLRNLIKQTPELQSELKEDGFSILRTDLRSRVLKDRNLLPENIKKKLENAEKKLVQYEEFGDSNIKLCLEEIKVKKGQSYEIISQIKSLYPEPKNLKNEKMRPTFTPELKKIWDYAENLIILSFLYHNGTLTMSLNSENLQYFKDQLIIIGSKKNQILEWMISQVQNEREWQFAVQELDEIQRKYLNSRKTKEIIKEKPIDNNLTKELPKSNSLSKKKKKPQKEEKKRIEEKQEEVKKEDPPKPEIDENLEIDLWKAFQERYSNNFDSIRSLCLLKNITFNEEDPNIGLKEFFTICKETLMTNKHDSTVKFESPYRIIAESLIKKCLFLLKLGSFYSFLQKESPLNSTEYSPNNLPLTPLTKERASFDDLTPPGLGRSISCQVEEKIDKEKLESFRLWIDSYQKWKVWQGKSENQETDLVSESHNAYHSISTLLCSKVKVEDLEFCLMRQNYRCGRRIMGLKVLNSLYEIVQGTLLEKYVLGVQTELFRFDCQRNIKCASKELKEMLLDPFTEGLKLYIMNFNRKFERMGHISLNDLTVEINKVKLGCKFSDLDSTMKEYLRILYLNLVEISTIISTQINRKYWDFWIDDAFAEEFIKNLLKLALFCRSLSFLSPNFEDLTLITQNLYQIIWLLSCRIIENISEAKSVSKLLLIVIALIGKEFGLYEGGKNLLNIRLLPRLTDLSTIQRLESLLSILYNLFILHENKLKDVVLVESLRKAGGILYHLLYFLNQPSLIRLLLKSLNLISGAVQMNMLPTVYDLSYFMKLALNYEDLAKNTKAQNTHQLINPMMIVKELNYEKPQMHLPLNNLTLIIEKLGQAILSQEDSKSLRSVLELEISRITKDLDYSKTIALTLAQNFSISSENAIQDQLNHPPLNSNKGSKHCSSTSSLKSEKNIKELPKDLPAKRKDTVVLIQLSNEEDISFLVSVFFYWEELYPSFSLKYPKTLEEFYKQKEEKQKRENEQKLNSIANSQNIEKCQTSSNNIALNPPLPTLYSHKIFEKLILNQPDFNLIDEDENELPFGWYLNYMGIYPDMKCPKAKPKQGKSKKCVKKVWANANLLKLEKKYESLIKSFEEIKESDSPEDKQQTLIARNLIARLMHHIKDVKNIATMLNVFGFAPILMAMPYKRASELGYIIKLGIDGLLKPIPLDQFKEDLKKKLDPNIPILPANPIQNPPIQPQKSTSKLLETSNLAKETKSQMVISMCDQTIYQNFDFTIDFVTSLTANKDSFYTDCNKFSIVHRSARSGSSNCSLIHELIEFLRGLVENNESIKVLIQKYMSDLTETLNKEDRWTFLSLFDKNLYVGLCNIIGGWTQTLRSGALTSIKNLERDNLCIVTQGGYTSGKKHCNIISRNDPSLLIQTVNSDQLELRFLNEWPKKGFELNYQGLLESIIHCFNSFRKLKELKSEETFSISIILRSLLQIAVSVEWNPLITSLNLPKDLLQILMGLLHELCQNCPVDKTFSYHEQAFANTWEKLIDKLDPSNQLFSIPQSFEPLKSYDFELEQKKALVSKPSEKNPSDLENTLNFVLPLSAYIESLPEHQQIVSEHKMLKYWEKHIIPRIQDFVRSSLKPWEFEDFFEQLRQPLRKGDQAKAAEVAYILCDQRLPAGVILPDVNHDWNTISIEEVQIGQWAIAKIHGTNNQLYSQFFGPQYKIGNTELCVQMLAVDSKSSSVLVMYQDHDNLQLISIWLPVLCLKLPEIALTPHVACLEYENIADEFTYCMNNSISLLSRQVLLKFFSIVGFSKSVDLQKEEKLLKQFNLPLMEIIKWSVLEELSEDPVEGWLDANELNSTLPNLNLDSNVSLLSHMNIERILQNRKEHKHLKLAEIQVFLNWLVKTENNNEHILHLMDWLKQTFPQICEYISSSSNYMNIYRTSLENASTPFSLNTFVLPQKFNDSISALCVSFKQEATLCLGSGLKFYSDECGINIIHHIQAGKEPKSKLKPLLFKMSNVWCSYYFNAEALPPYLQNQTLTNLPALVSGIPSSWSVCCWLLDSLSSSFMLSHKENAQGFLADLNRILIEGFEKMKQPVMLRELLAKLLVRNLRKLHHVLYRIPPHIYGKDEAWKGPDFSQVFFKTQGVSQEFVVRLIDEVARLRQNQSLELYTLYSSYIQELMELCITTMLPYTSHPELVKSIQGLLPENANNLPEGFLPLFNLTTLCNYIREEGQLTKELNKEIMDNIKLETQWDRLIYLENLPSQWTSEYILSSLSEIITKNQGRVLIPSIDLYLPLDPLTNKHQGVCIILLDGWAVLGIEEVVNTEKNEENIVNIEEQVEDTHEIMPEDKTWICDTCTLENSDDLVACGCCESPRPAGKKQDVVSEREIALELKRSDLSEVEKEIQKKDQLRFERFLQDINEFVQKYYDDKAKEKQLLAAEGEKKVVLEEKKELNPIEKKKMKNKEAKEKKKQEKQTKKLEIEKNKQLKKEMKKNRKKEEEEKQEEEKQEEEKQEEEKQDIKIDIGNNNKEIQNDNQPALIENNSNQQIPIERNNQQIQLENNNNNQDLKINNQEDKPHEENIKLETIPNIPFPLEETKELPQEGPSISSPILKPNNEENLIKSPEFSKGLVHEEFPAAKKCIVLFGSKIFDNNTASSFVRQMLSERCIENNNNPSIFKSGVQKMLKLLFSDILTKYWDKGLKEKLGKYAGLINMTSFEAFMNTLLERVKENPFDFWKMLEVLGYDFWCSNSGYNCMERPQVMPLKILSELMKYIEIELCQETKAVLTFSPLNIRLMNISPLQDSQDKALPINFFTELTLESKYFQLYRYSLKELRYAWSLLKIFNANLIPTVPFINMKTNDYSFDHIWLSLSAYLSCLREIWMMPIKRELSHKVLQKTAVNREEVPKIILERLKLNKENNKPVPKTGISLKNKDDFIFTRSFEQLKESQTTLLRPLKPQGAEPHISFEVIFKGENVMGEAGPYRQYFADISMELQPSALNPYSLTRNLNLLCPSPNNDARLGKGRDKFVVNPSAKSSYHLQLFEFLGILMGCSVRTGTHLTLDLPLLFWKQLVGQKIEFEDLEEVDESLKDLVNIFQNYSRVQFEETIMETFSTSLSNKTIVELKKGGSKIPVLFEDRYEYVQKVLQVRIKESMLQIEAIKKGMTLLIPLPFLNGISAKDLEIWVCGKPKVNIELLKRHTRYAGDLNDESRRVKFLWDVLGGMKENEKLRFVKFCWGQERLPANDEEFERTQTRFMIKPANYNAANTDKVLPRADTCFFNLELPDYSTKEILKERILLAINMDCDSMNAEDPKNLDPNVIQNDRDESSYDPEEEN